VPANYLNSHFPAAFYELRQTDESKLLPVPGIYAVSLESGEFRSKGMVVIHNESSGGPRVFLNIFENTPDKFAATPVICFHKKVHGAVNLEDHSFSAARMRAAVAEISDLIF
jgi:hypothetical protein